MTALIERRHTHFLIPVIDTDIETGRRVEQRHLWKRNSFSLFLSVARTRDTILHLSNLYFDDFISFNNKGFKEFISAIYPQRTSQFRRLQNLVQLHLISTCFLREMKTTT